MNWLLLDDAGRACLKEWQILAELPGGGQFPRLMAPNSIAEPSLRAAAPVERHPDNVPPMRITVLLDTAPFSVSNAGASFLSAADRVFLLETLSALLERMPASSVRLVVFNLEQQKELFRRAELRVGVAG